MKNILVAFLTFVLTSCQSYNKWDLKKQQNKEKVNMMNQALDLCNSIRIKNENPTKEFYDQYYQLKAKAGNIWTQYQNYDDLFYSDNLNRFRLSYKQAIYDCDMAVSTSFTIHKIEKVMEEENELSKNLGYQKGIFGYQIKNYNAGIINFLNYIYIQNKENSLAHLSKIIKDNQEFLIKANISDRNFAANQIIDNLVIYQVTNQYNQTTRFALMKEQGESYLENSLLFGKYFAIITTKELKIDGKTIEIFVLKNINTKTS
jgi:hypothetical protein